MGRRRLEGCDKMKASVTIVKLMQYEQSSSADWFGMDCPSHLCSIRGHGKDSDEKLRNP